MEDDFPNLRSEGYQLRSPVADRPNCIGWALYDRNLYWDAGMVGVKGYYWPPGVPRDDSLEAWTKVFEIHGYRICDNAELEPSHEKIAIYFNPKTGAPEHVARQKKSGIWISKMGKGADIEHKTLHAISGDLLGSPKRFMKRPRLPGAE